MREQFTTGAENEPKKTFVYVDHSKPDEPFVVFECSAIDIVDADKQYEEHTGKDPSKQPYIGCLVENPPEGSEN